MELEAAIREAVSEKLRALPPVQDPMRALVLARHRRAKNRRILLMTSALVTVPAVALGYGVATGIANARVKTNPNASAATVSPPAVSVRACGRSDLTDVHASWASVSDLVLTGTLQITSSAATPCALAAPQFTLVGDDGSPSGDNAPPADVVDATSSTVIGPAQSAAAIIRWGGSYCGPENHVNIRWTLLSGDAVTVPVQGVLRCVDSPYYDKGQTSAAASDFVVLP